MEQTQEYDVVVIGGGPAGENAAQYAVEGTGMTRRRSSSASCSAGSAATGRACPSKALLRPVAVAAITADLPGVSTAHVAAKALLERRDTWVSHYDDAGQATWAEGAGLGGPARRRAARRRAGRARLLGRRRRGSSGRGRPS